MAEFLHMFHFFYIFAVLLSFYYNIQSGVTSLYVFLFEVVLKLRYSHSLVMLKIR